MLTPFERLVGATFVGVASVLTVSAVLATVLRDQWGLLLTALGAWVMAGIYLWGTHRQARRRSFDRETERK